MNGDRAWLDRWDGQLGAAGLLLGLAQPDAGRAEICGLAPGAAVLAGEQGWLLG